MGGARRRQGGPAAPHALALAFSAASQEKF